MDQARAPEHTTYPDDVITWLTGDGGRVVLCPNDADLVARLEAIGHDVRTGRAKEHPDACVDVVVAVHRGPRDLDEIARVLRPEGRLAIMLPRRDERIPWVRKLDRIIGSTPVPAIADDDTASNVGELAPVITHGRFGFVDETTIRFWQLVDRRALLGVVASLPEVLALPQEEREAATTAVAELYDGYGRGADGMQLPWTAHLYRTTLAPPPLGIPVGDEEGEPLGRGDDGERDASGRGASGEESRSSDGTDTDMLLIDFR